jgi:integrase
MSLIKGITQKQNKDGSILYRVDTCINGKKCKSIWTTDILKAEKELVKLASLRRKHIPANQHTVVKNNITVLEFMELYYSSEYKKFNVNPFYKFKNRVNFLLRNVLNLKVNEVTYLDINLTGCRTYAMTQVNDLNKLNKFAKKELNKIPFYINTEELEDIAKTHGLPREKIYFLNARETAIMFKWLDENPGKCIKQSTEGTSKVYCNLKFKQAVIFSIYNGLRGGEVLALRKKNIDLVKGLMTVESTRLGNSKHGYKKGTKNGKIRIIQISPHTRKVIEDIFRDNPGMGPDDLFFPFTENFIEKRIEDLHNATTVDIYTGEIVPVLNSNYTFHTFRHTFASLFFKANSTKDNALRQLRDLMGHASIRQTEKYVHVYENMNSDLLENLTFTHANKIEKATQNNLKDSIKGILSGTHMTDTQFKQQVLDLLKSI